MKLTEHSRNRLLESFVYWGVPKEFADPMYNYLVHGFEPGGFFKGWYAKDATAIIRSHPANTVEALKALTKWMMNCLPREAWGSHEQVDAWLKMEPAQRRRLLEQQDLVYSEADEIVLLLKGERTVEPFFYN